MATTQTQQEKDAAELNRLSKDRAETRYWLGDAREKLRDARRREGALKETVERNGILARRPDLDDTSKEAEALAARIAELEKKEAALMGQSAEIGGRETYIRSLAGELGLSDEQRGLVSTRFADWEEEEGGKSREDDARDFAKKLRADNGAAAEAARDYSFKSENGVAW